jgi:hypothetical protein
MAGGNSRNYRWADGCVYISWSVHARARGSRDFFPAGPGMNRPASTLTKLSLVMAIGECISAVAIAVENYADNVPEFAVLF